MAAAGRTATSPAPSPRTSRSRSSVPRRAPAAARP
jgi:hypothetical protein